MILATTSGSRRTCSHPMAERVSHTWGNREGQTTPERLSRPSAWRGFRTIMFRWDWSGVGGRPSRRPAHAGRGRGRGRWEGARFPVRSGPGNGERPLQADLRPGPTGGTLRRAQRPGQVAWEGREGTADCAGPEGPGMAARPSARGQSLGRLSKRVAPPPGKAPTPERSVLPEPSPTALQGER